MFEPKVLTFLCNWCSYAGADHAGASKLEYPAGVRIVRVMCSGRVDAGMILSAFRAGADGVVVLGCHPGDCHYKSGNHRARDRAALLGAMLLQLGIEPARFRLDWVSATEGERFRELLCGVVDDVRALGPLRLCAPGLPGREP